MLNGTSWAITAVVPVDMQQHHHEKPCQNDVADVSEPKTVAGHLTLEVDLQQQAQDQVKFYGLQWVALQGLPTCFNILKSSVPRNELSVACSTALTTSVSSNLIHEHLQYVKGMCQNKTNASVKQLGPIWAWLRV